MVIVVKDANWEEDDKYIFITLPLRGASPKKLDVLSSEEYLKIAYPPYLFECFLNGNIEDTKSSVEIQDGKIVAKLLKSEQGLWGSLNHPKADDKGWKAETRDAAILRIQQRAEEQNEMKAKTKQDLGRFAVKKQMQLEDQERARINDVKESEVLQATEDLEKWRQQQEEIKSSVMENMNPHGEAGEGDSSKVKKKKKSSKKAIFESDQPIRESGTITISCTPRVFPTPSRESTAHDENEWLRKQNEARKIAQIDDEDLTEEERNPQYLKDKGDNFYKAGNLLAAINAYTQAIRLSPKLPSLYSNRGACHLKLRNMFKCIEDCSKALDLLNPPVKQNAASRCKAFIRRGMAFCHLEMYVEGLMDYEAALKIDPNNDEVRLDAEKIRQVIQSDSVPGSERT